MADRRPTVYLASWGTSMIIEEHSILRLDVFYENRNFRRLQCNINLESCSRWKYFVWNLKHVSVKSLHATFVMKSGFTAKFQHEICEFVTVCTLYLM